MNALAKQRDAEFEARGQISFEDIQELLAEARADKEAEYDDSALCDWIARQRPRLAGAVAALNLEYLYSSRQ